MNPHKSCNVIVQSLLGKIPATEKHLHGLITSRTLEEQGNRTKPDDNINVDCIPDKPAEAWSSSTNSDICFIDLTQEINPSHRNNDLSPQLDQNSPSIGYVESEKVEECQGKFLESHCFDEDGARSYSQINYTTAYGSSSASE